MPQTWTDILDHRPDQSEINVRSLLWIRFRDQADVSNRRLSSKSRIQHESGKIQNMVSSDASYLVGPLRNACLTRR